MINRHCLCNRRREGLHRARLGDADEQVAQRVGIEDVGVVHHGEGRRLVQPQFPVQLGALVGCLPALQVILALGQYDGSSYTGSIVPPRLPCLLDRYET